MTTITICSSRLPKDAELLPRAVRLYLQDFRLEDLEIQQEPTPGDPGFKVTVDLPAHLEGHRLSIEVAIHRALSIKHTVEFVPPSTAAD